MWPNVLCLSDRAEFRLLFSFRAQHVHTLCSDSVVLPSLGSFRKVQLHGELLPDRRPPHYLHDLLPLCHCGFNMGLPSSFPRVQASTCCLCGLISFSEKTAFALHFPPPPGFIVSTHLLCPERVCCKTRSISLMFHVVGGHLLGVESNHITLAC